MSCYSKFLTRLGSVLILLAGFVVSGVESVTTHAATLETTIVGDAIVPAVTSFQEIGVLRKTKPIDADAILVKYTGSLQALTQEVDAKFTLTLDSILLAAIEAIRNNKEPDLAAQVIDKTLQRVFFQTILERITSVRDEFDSKSTAELGLKWDEATAAFEAIRGTAARENKVITADRQAIETGSNPGLDVQISDALARGKLALNKANATEDKIAIGIERQIIRLSMARVYYIGVLREIEGIVSNRDREVEEALEKQTEGEYFYRIIEQFVSIDNPAGNVLIKSQLTGSVFGVSVNELVSELSKGFIGRVKSELNANESSVGADRERAMIVAEEALLYANVFLPDLEVRLGSVAGNNLNNALNDLKNASNAGDVTRAGVARQSITDILSSYEDELVLAQYNKTNITSFLDPAILAFQTIGVLRKQNSIDADAITAEYVGELQQLTQFADEVYGLTLNNTILSAIADIKNGNRENLAAQVIDKTFQRVFGLTIYNRVTLVQNAFDSMPTDALELEWDRAFAAYQAIIGTATRENKVLSADRQTIETGSKPGLDSKVTVAFIRGRDALKKESADDRTNVAVEGEVIILSLVRSFFIGVLREVEGIIAHRDREIEEAQEKQIEGEFFYRIVEGFVSHDNPVGSNIVSAQLTGSAANVVADKIVSEINRGLIGRINTELDINAATVDSDRHQAVIAAENAFLYADIFLPDLELRLSALQRVKIENALRDLRDASSSNDENKASEARQAISLIIADYKDELI